MYQRQAVDQLQIEVVLHFLLYLRNLMDHSLHPAGQLQLHPLGAQVHHSVVQAAGSGELALGYLVVDQEQEQVVALEERLPDLVELLVLYREYKMIPTCSENKASLGHMATLVQVSLAEDKTIH
jgi:hypothetical protein